MSRLGLALGGGGARGLAHIGVLKILDEEEITPRVITGCSMGAVVGGLYAYYGSAETVEEAIYRLFADPLFADLGIDQLEGRDRGSGKNYFEQFVDFIGARMTAFHALNKMSHFTEEKTTALFEFIPDVPIESLRIPFSAVATDLISGEEINIAHGSLRTAVRASSAIPGIFPPVRIGGHLLVDGSASQSVPASTVRDLGADRVLAVDVMRSLTAADEPKNVVDVLYRTEDITSYHLSRLRLREADLIITPDVRRRSWTDFDSAEEIIAAGEQATAETIKEIKQLVRQYSLLLGIDYYFRKIRG